MTFISVSVSLYKVTKCVSLTEKRVSAFFGAPNLWSLPFLPLFNVLHQLGTGHFLLVQYTRKVHYIPSG